MGTAKERVTKKSCPLTKKGKEGMFLGPGSLGGDTTVMICSGRGLPLELQSVCFIVSG